MMLRPVAYWQHFPKDGDVATVWGGGNPLIWWGALTGMTFTAIYTFERPTVTRVFLLSGYLAYTLMWVWIGRTLMPGMIDAHQHATAGIIHSDRGVKVRGTRRADELIAHQASDARAAGGVLSRAVAAAAQGRAGGRRRTLRQMLRLDAVVEIDVAVRREMRIQRETRETQRTDRADFVREIDQR